MCLRIGDYSYLKKFAIGVANEAAFNALHLPIFRFLEANDQKGYSWSPGSTRHVMRLYISSNRTRLITLGKEEQSLCLLDVRLGTGKMAILLVKPFGDCYELLDQGRFSLDAPIAWIWAFVLNVELTNEPLIRSGKMHVPITFNKISTVLAKTTYRYIAKWIRQKNF